MQLWPLRKEEDYVMRSFYTGNDVIIGCASNLGASAEEYRNKRLH